MKNSGSQIFIGIIVIVLACGASFYGGVMYQKNQAKGVSQTTNRNGLPNFGNGQGFGGGGSGFGMRGGSGGTIESINGNTITVKTVSGDSETINFSSSTTFSKTSTGSSSDLATGQNIIVRGTSNSDGSVSAMQISIR